MANKISEEVKLQVVQLKKLGKTYSEISNELGIGKGSVSNICKEAGLGQIYIELTPDKIEECQKLYDEIGNIKIYSENKVNDFLDWFGKDVRIQKIENNLKFTVYASIESIKFWLLQFGKYVKVLSPQALCDAIKNDIDEMKNLYN